MLVLGVGAYVASAPLMMYDVTGWPWHASVVAQGESGRVTATIDSGDGQVESFTGSEEQANAWMDREEAELKAKHGIDTKLAIGRALGYLSYALLVLGSVILIGHAIGVVRNRRT